MFGALAEERIRARAQQSLDGGRALEALLLARELVQLLLVGRVQVARELETALLNDGMLEPELVVGGGEHVHLVRISRHELVHLHGLRLADAMAAGHRLHVVLRVPVGVVDDDRVGGRQINPHAARTCREEEEERLRLRIGR